MRRWAVEGADFGAKSGRKMAHFPVLHPQRRGPDVAGIGICAKFRPFSASENVSVA
jgi:hypothetical protein